MPIAQNNFVSLQHRLKILDCGGEDGNRGRDDTPRSPDSPEEQSCLGLERRVIDEGATHGLISLVTHHNCGPRTYMLCQNVQKEFGSKQEKTTIMSMSMFISINYRFPIVKGGGGSL